jgi:GH15 family glucan-1,4-alpha-glucosidase
LMHGGYSEEARAWRDWLLRAVAGRPDQVQVLYGLSGERPPPERELPWLPGYEGAGPVRLGNRAATQLQLDIYGEVVDAFYHADRHGIRRSRHGEAVRQAMFEHLSEIWQRADKSIWEVRGPAQRFTYSKVMAWVAFDRAVRMVESAHGEGAATPWRRLRDTIHREICARAFDPQLGSFVQAYGSKALDASLLLMPLVGFLPPEDPRVQGTVKAIEQRLFVDGLVLRYDTGERADGLPPGEGAFLACSFWLADNYVLQGRVEEARDLFCRLLELCNDVGLLAEEYDPHERRQLGNFPQAFSHVALVNTAFNLTRAKGPAAARAHTEAEAAPAK